MSNYQNSLCNQFNSAVLRYGAKHALAKVPAHFDADKICFPTKFVSYTPILENQQKQFLDAAGTAIAGSKFHPVPDGDIISSFCSLGALHALSHDTRIKSLWFGNPVDVDKILALKP